MSPLLFPAIDLRDGRCVRLLQGEFDRETDYGDDPVGWARSFEEAGAPWLHVVDLDGARTGVSRNGESIRAVVSAVDVPVQVGGGVRNVGDACALFDAGVDRVVMGTAAVEYPDLVTFDIDLIASFSAMPNSTPSKFGLIFPCIKIGRASCRERV